jgi:transposase
VSMDRTFSHTRYGCRCAVGMSRRARSLVRSRDLEQYIDEVETELTAIAREIPMVKSLLKIPGLGLLTATALFATIGNIHAFKSGRQLACWLGLTPRESSSGGQRRLGRISKQGDAYVRMLFIHGARAALNGARRLESRDQPPRSSRSGR